MLFLSLSFICLIVGGGVSFFANHKKFATRIIGPGTAILGCLLALYPAFCVLLGFSPAINFTLTQYALPVGSIIFNLDPLAALFLVPTLLVAALCAGYGVSYLSRGHSYKKNLGAHWFFYNLLILGLILTFIAADAFLFMVAWEIMSLTPFFLIIFNDTEEQVRKGASSYLIAAHIGGLFLLAFFLLLSAQNGGALDFQTFGANAKNLQATGVLFILALIGFGTKAGLMPMHVWLPEAHPAAPGHISAVMSGVMLNTGIYGIVRTLAFLGDSQSWWAFTLIGVGVFSAVIGIFLALTNKSIKRALAFSSIENMGIVCIALGFGLYALQCANLTLALLFIVGGLLHLVNHSFYKSLLFLVAGSVAKDTGTDFINQLGGLQKRAPFLGLCFFIGAAAICALPPLNGFASKLILYLGFAVGGSTVANTGFVYWGGLLILAGVSGFSLFCFTKIFGLTFLGSPRSALANKITEPPRLEKTALIIIICLCFGAALLAPFVVKIFAFSLEGYVYSLETLTIPFSAAVEPFAEAAISKSWQLGVTDIFNALIYVNIGFIIFALLALVLYRYRKHMLKSKTVSVSPTWDCGYAKPSPRMQYTGGSFSQAVTYLMGFILRPKAVLAHFAGYFPATGHAELSTEDWVKTSLYSRFFMVIARIALWAKRIQRGHANTYILYIFITLVVLLAWKIR